MQTLADAMRHALGADYRPLSAWEARVLRPRAVETPEELAARRLAMAERDARLWALEQRLVDADAPGCCAVCGGREDDGYLLGGRWLYSLLCAEELDNESGASGAREAAC